MSIQRTCLVALGLLLPGATSSPGQDLEILPGIQQSIANIPGVGAWALSLAGASTALADDATAAALSPAGLSQLERPEAPIVYDFCDANNDDDKYERTRVNASSQS